MNIANFAFRKLYGLVKPSNYNTNVFRPVALLKKTPTQMFSCEIWEIFKNTFSDRTLPMAVSDHSKFGILTFKMTLSEMKCWMKQGINRFNMKIVLSESENVKRNAKQTAQCCCMETYISLRHHKFTYVC